MPPGIAVRRIEDWPLEKWIAHAHVQNRQGILIQKSSLGLHIAVTKSFDCRAAVNYSIIDRLFLQTGFQN